MVTSAKRSRRILSILSTMHTRLGAWRRHVIDTKWQKPGLANPYVDIIDNDCDFES